MKKYRYIAVLLVVVAGLALSARADDYVDDVYYWDTPQRTQQLSDNKTEDYQATEEEYTDAPTDSRQTEITFIEDSVTRNNAAVIKAIIKR